MSDDVLRTIRTEFLQAIRDDLTDALENAYSLGLEFRRLTPSQNEHEALLRVLSYAREIECRGATDWEQRHLAKAIEDYDALVVAQHKGVSK